MRLYELLGTCSNKWVGSTFNLNPLFKIKLSFEYITFNQHAFEYIFICDYFDNISYLNKYRDRIVKSWFISGLNDIIVILEGHS